MTDSNRNDNKVESNINIKSESNFNSNAFSQDNLSPEIKNFNSKSSGYNREIPKEAKKIVDDLFEDSSVQDRRSTSKIFESFNMAPQGGQKGNQPNNLKRIESLMRNMDHMNSDAQKEDFDFGQFGGVKKEEKNADHQVSNVESDRNDWGNWDFDDKFAKNSNKQDTNNNVVPNRAEKYKDTSDDQQAPNNYAHDNFNFGKDNQINLNYPNSNILIRDMKEVKINNPQSSISFADKNGNEINQNNAPNMDLDFSLLVSGNKGDGNKNFKGNDNNLNSIMDKNKEINFDDILNNVNLKDKENAYNYDKDFGIKKHNSNSESRFQDEEYINLKKFATNSPNKNRGNLGLSQNTGRAKNLKNEPIVEKQVNFNLAFEKDVPYGKSKIAKESKENILDRKSHVINDDNFSTNKNSVNAILRIGKSLGAYMNLEEEPLNIQIQLIFEDMLMRSDDMEKIKSELMSIELDENINQSPIGFLCGLDRAVVQTGLHRAESHFHGIERAITAWREVLGDGNCFYRAFMFATLESYILNKDVFKIKKILYDLNVKINKTFKRKDVSVDKNIINIIFYFIIDFIENNKVREAYDVFIKAYHLYKTFDYGLIKYMRAALAEYILENQQILYSSEPDMEIAALLPEAYISKSGYNFNAFTEDHLLAMHNEAEKIIIYLSPIVFNVNLDFYILEGVANLQKNISFFKQTLPCLLGDNKLDNFASTITLFYRFSHYDTFYTSQVMSEFGNSITFSIFDRTKIVDASKQRITVLASVQCESCNRNSELLLFYHMPSLSLCKLCLTDFVNKIILKRSKNYSSEFFNNKEYYCRPILVDAESNYFLYDEDLVFLTGKTIAQQFLLYLDQVCMFCQGSIVEGAYYTMPCECKICSKCCEAKINTATDGKIVLNNFEKAYFSQKNPQCACGCQFDVEYAITISKNNIDTYIDQAQERLTSQVQTYCAMCRTNTAKDKDKALGPTAANKFPIVHEDDPNVVNTSHVLCKQCIITLKGDLIRMSRQGKIGSKIPLKCIICSKKIHKVELKYLKPFMKDGEGGCCSIL